MKNLTENQAKNFKRSYAYKMGGSQTLIFPNGQTFYFNDKEYYSGRGVKYNKSINHDEIGEVIISKKEVSNFFKKEREWLKIKAATLKANKERLKSIETAAKDGIYNIVSSDHGAYVELSDDEASRQYFDIERLANTLDISVNDARLLTAKGKTYVFAKQSNGSIIMLYHASLSCNSLSISVDYNAEDRFKEFSEERASWVNAPYADLVGQTENLNHFVC